MKNVEFFVPGIPRPQGSKSFKGMRGGRPILTESSAGLPEWRAKISQVARLYWRGGPWDGPLGVTYEFIMPRPKQWGRTRNDPMTQRPDGDKLERAVNDGLTGIAFKDDSQIVAWTGSKRRAQHGEQPGVRIVIMPLVMA